MLICRKSITFGVIGGGFFNEEESSFAKASEEKSEGARFAGR